MKTLFFIILMLSGILMTISILLMSPKWWLWLGIWWASAGGWDYGSQKTVESSLKKPQLHQQ